MAKIFISHSSRDKEFVRRLALDLREMGHEPWLDEWEIRVGDCIVTEVGKGVSEAHYVVIVLSPNSVISNWVEREWKTKYWEEIERQQTQVLPILLQDCTIPPLLKTKKYADFRKNYTVAFVQLMGAIAPVIGQKPSLGPLQPDNRNKEISQLLANVQSRSIPLSQSLAEALALAQQANHKALEDFCRNELAGYMPKDTSLPAYRLVEVFVCPYGRVNMQYYGWGGSASIIFEYMRQNDKEFVPAKIGLAYSVSHLESQQSVDPTKMIMTFTLRLDDIASKTDNPDMPVAAYARANTYLSILESIRRELTIHLLDMLPRVREVAT